MPDACGEALPVEQARALIGRALPPAVSEAVATVRAAGRVLVAPVTADADLPADSRAARNGYAVHAADTGGAGDYAPLSLILCDGRANPVLPRGAAAAVSSGDPLPGGADAVLPLEAATSAANAVEILLAVAPGSGVEPRGGELSRGALALARGRRLRPPDLGLLVALGISSVPVQARLRVGVIAAGPKSGGPDAVTPMLRAMLLRDGADVAACSVAGRDRRALAGAITHAAADTDLLIVAGASGDGADDSAAAAITDAGGAPVFHGAALRPGGTAGLWRAGDVPVLLLPGAPLACMIAYDVLASAALRRVDAAYDTTDALLDRKIVSQIGCMDAVRVTLKAGLAAPLAGVEAGGLASLSRADGFVLVPEASEGFAPGSRVVVHRYGSAPGEAA